MENTAKAEVQKVKDNKQHQDEIIYCHWCLEAFKAARQAHSKPSVPPNPPNLTPTHFAQTHLSLVEVVPLPFATLLVLFIPIPTTLFIVPG